MTVLDDSHDDGGETLTLTLSNASNGTLGDSTATGTIENSDPLPKALVARFGRTPAVHIVEQVEERVNAPRQPGFDGRLAGRRMHGDMGREFALDFLQQLGGGAGYTPMGTGRPMHGPGGATTGAAAMGHAGGAPVNGGGLTPMGASGMQPMQPAHGPDGMGMSLGHGSLLTGSGFALNRVTKTGGILSFWSRTRSRSSTAARACWRSTATSGRRCSAPTTARAGWSRACRCRTAEASAATPESTTGG